MIFKMKMSISMTMMIVFGFRSVMAISRLSSSTSSDDRISSSPTRTTTTMMISESSLDHVHDHHDDDSSRTNDRIDPSRDRLSRNQVTVKQILAQHLKRRQAQSDHHHHHQSGFTPVHRISKPSASPTPKSHHHHHHHQ